MARSITGLPFFERLAASRTSGSSSRSADAPLRPSGNTSSDGRPDDLPERFGNLIAGAPGVTFAVLMVLTAIFTAAFLGALPTQENSMGDNISTNVDQYIPDDTEETRILDIVRENWATKVVIVFIQTGNAIDPEVCKTNITDRDVLEEISSVEGDDFYAGANFERGDSGKHDYIEYIFSLPVLIKEINSSSPRMANMLEAEMATELEELFGVPVDVSGDDEALEDQAKYSIPADQSTVDQIIAQIPYDVLTAFCADTNNDGIWDSTYTMMGCIEETPDEEEFDFVNHVMDERRPAQDSDAQDPYFKQRNGPDHHTTMTQTGLIAIMVEITEEVGVQLSQVMPIAILLVLLVMVISHRHWKVIPIALLPLLCTMLWTFGIITLTNLELSPIIVAAMPMLIGLSVDYSLHISNRITEYEEEGYTVREGIVRTYRTTGIAVLLSAVTTIIGFAALLIAPLSPIVMLGLMLIVGIASAFILSLTMVPCLVIMFHYRKKELQIWKKVGTVPVKHRWAIIGVVALVTLASLVNLSAMTDTPEERQEMDSQGLGSLEAINQMSEIWARGSTSLLVIEPKPGEYPNGGALNDTEFLDQIEWMEQRLTRIENKVDTEDVSAMTVVDLYKSVAVNLSYKTAEGHTPDPPFPLPIDPTPIIDPITDELTWYYTYTYWEFVHLSDDPEFQSRAIRIFYNSLTAEARDMLMTPDYSMTLCMIQYANEGRAIQEQIIDNINDISDDTNNRPNSTTKVSHATSGAAISLIIHEAIMDTQQTTLILSLIFVYVALIVVFFNSGLPKKRSSDGTVVKRTSDDYRRAGRSALMFATLTMIPVSTVVGWQPLIMKSVSSVEGGASLNFMTAMISSIVIGAGIDFGVHITERIREEGTDKAGIQRAVRHTGQSIMEANLTTVAGLSGGLAVVWFRGFFSVLLLLLLYSMFAGMILLPAVYAAMEDIRKKRRGTDYDDGDDDIVDAESGLDDREPQETELIADDGAAQYVDPEIQNAEPLA